MNNLSAFLNPIKIENVKYVASERFVDENGQPIEWEIGCITSAEDERIRSACTRRRQVPGKRNQFANETDFNEYLGMLAARCTVSPDLNDAALQDGYGAKSADELLKAMLTPGEYAAYLARVQDVNGFDRDFGEAVEQAKN